MGLFRTIIIRTASLMATFALGASSIFACSAGGNAYEPTDGNGAAGSGSQAGTGGGGPLLDATTGDGSLTEAGACASQSYPGKLVPLDLHIMFDQSSSMNDAGKWSSCTQAFKTFLQAPESSGIGVSIQYFPLAPPAGSIPGPCSDNAQCGIYGPCLPGLNVCSGSFSQDTSCDVADYDEPEVPIGELPGHAQAIIGSIDAHGPEGAATPTQPAFAGVANYATAWAKANPSHLTYILLATDGEPTGCEYSGGINATATIAEQASNDSPPVKTFVIGVGSELGALNSIAMAGKTGQAYLVDTGSSVADQFVEALNEIRAAGACKFQIPAPDTGVLDYNLVNVDYLDPPNEAVNLKYVNSAAECSATEGGWYYDNPADPKMIVLCDASCEMVMLGDGSIDVLLGCKRITY